MVIVYHHMVYLPIKDTSGASFSLSSEFCTFFAVARISPKKAADENRRQRRPATIRGLYKGARCRALPAKNAEWGGGPQMKKERFIARRGRETMGRRSSLRDPARVVY